MIIFPHCLFRKVTENRTLALLQSSPSSRQLGRPQELILLLFRLSIIYRYTDHDLSYFRSFFELHRFACRIYETTKLQKHPANVQIHTVEL